MPVRCFRWRTDDGGYATVAAAGFAAVLVMLCVVVVWQVGAVVAAAEAQRGADLAAVAGAYRIAVGEGPEAACASADLVAQLNDASMDWCEITGEDVTVEITVRGRSAQARAGPV